MDPNGPHTTPTQFFATISPEIAQIGDQASIQSASPAGTVTPAEGVSSDFFNSSEPPEPQESMLQPEPTDARGAPTRPPSIPSHLLGQYYVKVAQRMYEKITKEWVPEVWSPEDRAKELYETQQRILGIKQIELQYQKQKAVKANTEGLEKMLFVARINHRVRFLRIFRINDLPIEIFSNILHLICSTAPDPSATIRWPLHLTWVCRHWRAVMIEDQTMWNTLWLSDTFNYNLSMIWLERAGNTAIDVRINDSKEKPWTLAIARAVVERLFAKLSTIRVLVVILQDWDAILYLVHEFQRVKTHNMPMIMERLELHRTGQAYVQAGIQHDLNLYRRSTSLFGGANVPTLRHITINGINIDWASDVLGNLLTIDMRRIPIDRGPTAQELYNILLNSPTMNKLVFTGAGPRLPTTHILPPPVEMRDLVSVALGDVSPAYGAYTVSRFTCPNLLDLTLMNLIRQDFAPFYQSLTNRMPLMRVLTQFGADLPPGGDALAAAQLVYVKFLEALPEVKYLRINAVSHDLLNLYLWDSKHMVSAVGIVGAVNFEHPVCPKLEVLEYHQMDTQFISTWVAARRNMGLPLKKVYIGESTLRIIPKADGRTLVNALGGLGIVQVLNPILRPMEELELLRR